MAKKSEHYVDNSKFLAALVEYRAACHKAERSRKKEDRIKPPVPEYIGECFLRISQHLSYKPNFVGYTYRDDMVSDGVENALVYIHNFDPAKSSNPFGYFTQVIYFAFIRRIQREKRHTYIKYKLMERSLTDGVMEGDASTNRQFLQYDNIKDFTTRFEDSLDARRERRRVKKGVAE